MEQESVQLNDNSAINAATRNNWVLV